MTFREYRAPRGLRVSLELCYGVLAVTAMAASALALCAANDEAGAIRRLKARIADAPSTLVCFDAGGVPIGALSEQQVFHECRSAKVLTDEAN